MFESPEAREPQTRNERLIVAAFALLILGGFVADVAADFHPAKLSILFMLLAWAPLLVLHEAGHALAAHALGWRLEGIVLGFGRPVARTRVAGTEVEVRALPVEGFVRCSPRSIDGVRWKSAVIYFAGPGIELALAASLLVVAGPETLLQRSDAVGMIALQSIAAASCLGAVLNLLPHSTLTPDGELPSDGLGILVSLTRPLDEWQRELQRRALVEPD